ncbi:MAG: type II toxin-antitoxin system Phd/YefM family antitoxin [Thermoleophilia bacterium]|nr:type II toxin-antitoxin system Phd/YefM family antitoxin [Thermoleophilia bacterium]
MAETVSKSKFKARALEYLRHVEQSGQELIITDRGRPVAKVVPLSTDVDSLLAPFRGALSWYKEPTEPVGEDDWEALK